MQETTGSPPCTDAHTAITPPAAPAGYTPAAPRAGRRVRTLGRPAVLGDELSFRVALTPSQRAEFTLACAHAGVPLKVILRHLILAWVRREIVLRL